MMDQCVEEFSADATRLALADAGRQGGREGGREEGRKGGREGGREEGREGAPKWEITTAYFSLSRFLSRAGFCGL